MDMHCTSPYIINTSTSS